MAVQITDLAITPVKGTRLRSVRQVELERDGARGDRRFFLIDGRDRMVNAKQLGDLLRVRADFNELDRRLTLEFPDQGTVSGPVAAGAAVDARFFSRVASGVLVEGPWAEALSDVPGPDGPPRGRGRRRRSGPSGGGLADLARLAGPTGIDRRRKLGRLPSVPDARRDRRRRRARRGSVGRATKSVSVMRLCASAATSGAAW